MSQLDLADIVAEKAKNVAAAYVPPLQRTQGQPPPIAANGGLSYMSFDRNGDAGTAEAFKDALAKIASGDDRRTAKMIEAAPPGPVETQWGPAFRSYAECLEYIRAKGIIAPEGGLALPLPYTVDEQTTYSVVSSHAVWRDPAQAETADLIRQSEKASRRRDLYFPQIPARCAADRPEFYPGLSPRSPESMDRLGVSLAHLESKCSNFYDPAEVERVFYAEIEKLLLDFFPGATDALVYNHDVFNKDYEGDPREDQDNKNPGVNKGYANLVHNDLNDNSGRVRCRELLTKNLRNFGRTQHYSEAEAGPGRCLGGSCRSISAKPMETVEQFPFVLCAWPSLRRPSRTSPTTASTTTASARPRASPIDPSTSGTGFPTRSRPRSRC